jgi:glycosyltransferase involved in cell wall biosynthesis
MKICLVVDKIPKYKIGGAEKQFFMIANGLVERGHEVHMTCRRREPDQPDRETIDGITVHAYGPPIGSQNRYREFLATRRSLLGVLSRADCDVYHTTPGSPLAGWTRLYTRVAGGHCALTLAHANDHTRSHWREQPRYRRALYHYGLKNADARVVLAEYMQDGLQAEYGLDADIIRYGYPLADDARFADKQDSVIWIARFQDWKRPELFVDLADRAAVGDWTFHLFGFADDESYEQELRESCAAVDSVEFGGRLTGDEDMEWFKRAKLFVNTSTAEGFPNTFIQSWVSGTPVATLEVDPDGLIADNEAGIAEPDFDAFVDRVRAVLEDEAELQRLSENARELGRAFDIERTVDEYEALYERLLAT